jgi:hypothetical protein
MKTKQTKYTRLAAVAAVTLAAMAGINTVKAQTWIATFNTDLSEIIQGEGGTPGSTGTYTWDSTQNGPTEPTSPSGSLYATIPWANVGTWQESQITFAGNNNLGNFVNIQMDIKVDVANSHLAPNGTFGQVRMVCNNWSGAQQGWLPTSTVNITNTGNWQHITLPLVGTPSYAQQLVLNIIGNGTVTNTCAYWVDNIALVSAALPPPTLNVPQFAPKQHGLTLIPQTTSQYQRVMVYPNAASPQYGWYGQASAGNPVSYSFTITNFPSYGDYTAQMFFIPIASMEYNQNDTSVDWNCTNDVIFSIGAESNSIAGGTQATNWDVRFATKTNSPGSLGNGNPNLTITNWTVTTLPLGTWTVTFVDNADFSITSPNGSVVTGTLPPDVVNLVSGNYAGNTQMAPYLGIQNNNTGSIGMPAVISNIKISGTASTAINDNFTTALTNNWNILSDEPSDVFINNGDFLAQVSWTTPNDGGYSSLEGAASAAGPWNDVVAASSWVNMGANKGAYVNKSAVVAATGQSQNALFKLIKRQFTQLQVLLPGMTNAPGTALGYTGSPTPQSLSVNLGIVPVTVNACDSTWHIVNSGDQIEISSPGGSGLVDGQLSAGTYTSTTFSFASTGSWTVTATDTTDGTKTPNTSPAVTVGP